jgi:hypothetical protein
MGMGVVQATAADKDEACRPGCSLRRRVYSHVLAEGETAAFSETCLVTAAQASQRPHPTGKLLEITIGRIV